MNTDVMFSKASDEWSTPDDLFAALHREFHFTFDAAATKENRKVEKYFGPDHVLPQCQDALSARWPAGVGWLNPPYSKCRQFIQKAASAALSGGTTVVCLVPSRTDTRWWHENVWDDLNHCPRAGVSIRFIRGRLKFRGSTNSAPFPSVVIVFRP